MIKKDVLFADASRVHRAKSNALCPFQNNGSGRFDHVLVSPWKKENSLSSSPLSTCPSLAVASLPRRSFRDNAVPLARQHRGSFERCVRGDDDCEHRVSSYREDVIARPSMRMLASTFAIPASHVESSSLTYQPSREDRWRNRWNRSWSSCSRPGIPLRCLQIFFFR